MAVGLIKRSDQRRYRPLITDTHDKHGYGHDVYQKTFAVGHNMLEDYAQSKRLYSRGIPKGRDNNNNTNVGGMMFTQTELTSGTNDKTYKTVQCHGCKK